jgi:hypothetical protein
MGPGPEKSAAIALGGIGGMGPGPEKSAAIALGGIGGIGPGPEISLALAQIPKTNNPVTKIKPFMLFINLVPLQ